MRVLLLCGDHLRHSYLAERVAECFDVCGVIRQLREPSVLQPPDGLSDLDSSNFQRHFEDRSSAERKYFGSPAALQAPALEIGPDGLNGESALRFVAAARADVALVFGTGLLGNRMLDCLPRHTVNMHLGLSPRYRGAATLFWPFYFLEPAWAGVTFHHLVAEPDAGQIIHQARPTLCRSDGIHDVGCRSVQTAAEAVVFLLHKLDVSGNWVTHSQRGTGKNFLARDFQAQHLRVIYQLFDNDIVRAYLDGELPHSEPALLVQPGCQG